MLEDKQKKVRMSWDMKDSDVIIICRINFNLMEERLFPGCEISTARIEVILFHFQS